MFRLMKENNASQPNSKRKMRKDNRAVFEIEDAAAGSQNEKLIIKEQMGAYWGFG